MRKIILLFSTIFLFLQSNAQVTTNEQLALQYYQEEDYEKAYVLFDELFHENKSEYYYNYYFNCLIQLKYYEIAEKELKKLVKERPDVPEYKIDLGYIYKLTGNARKQEKQYDKIIKDLIPDEALILKTANAFTFRDEIDMAIETYKAGRKLLGIPTLFAHPLYNLYRYTNNTEKMMEEILSILDNSPSQLSAVQNSLQDYIQEEKKYDIIREITLKKVQESNYRDVYVNLLSWLFIQKKEFGAAFRQLKAQDKRKNTNNSNLVRLAEVCNENHDYETAVEIYEYVVSKGSNTPYYYHSKFGLLDVMYLNVKENDNPNEEDLLKLEEDFTEYLAKNFYRHIQITEKVILHLTEIQAFYLNKPSEAINNLIKYMNYPQISKSARAKMKIQLGDLYVFSNELDEAVLIYKQAGLMFKDHPIGHEAKFRTAKLAFYRGQFDWATTQLDVLKGSTSELIANDALQLSLLIQNVLEMDTSTAALKKYAKAEFYIFVNQYDLANAYLDSLLEIFPGHQLTDEVYFAKAQIETFKANYNQALFFYEKVYEDYSYDLLADEALYNAALINEEKLNDTASAKELYEKLILDHPESVFVVDARKRYRQYSSKEDEFFRTVP
jgi:tetratricopeptide (TPR) repeat protein